MAKIRSGQTTDELTIDAASKAARATLYDASGVIIGTVANPLKVSIPSTPGYVNTYGCASWRTTATVATTQPLMTIRNNAGARNIRIRRLAIDVTYSAAAVFLTQAYFRLWHRTGVTPSGGSAPTKLSYDSTNSPASDSQAATEILFASSADGVAAAITHATPASTPMREQAHPNVLTAVGVQSYSDLELQSFEQDPIVIRPGETVALILICSANNIATQHYAVKLVWDEVTI